MTGWECVNVRGSLYHFDELLFLISNQEKVFAFKSSPALSTGSLASSTTSVIVPSLWFLCLWHPKPTLQHVFCLCLICWFCNPGLNSRCFCQLASTEWGPGNPIPLPLSASWKRSRLTSGSLFGFALCPFRTNLKELLFTDDQLSHKSMSAVC